MQIPKFQFTFKKNTLKTSPTGLCGLQFSNNGFAIAHILWQDGGPKLRHVEFVPVDTQDLAKTLQALSAHVEKNKLTGLRCNWVLQPTDYVIIPVGSLPVAESEVAQAVRWHVKDRLDYPIAEAVVSYFTTPHKTHTSQEEFIYAVAAKKDFLENMSHVIRDSGLGLEIIDAPEFVLRNLMRLSPYKNRSIGIIEVDEKKATLMIIQKGLIYLLRQIEWDKTISAAESIVKLSAEVQRSLDYYESELGQSVVEHFYLSPSYPSLHASLQEGLPLTLENLDIGQLLNSPLEKEKEKRCFAAIGGALRREESHETTN